MQTSHFLHMAYSEKMPSIPIIKRYFTLYSAQDRYLNTCFMYKYIEVSRNNMRRDLLIQIHSTAVAVFLHEECFYFDTLCYLTFTLRLCGTLFLFLDSGGRIFLQQEITCPFDTTHISN